MGSSHDEGASSGGSGAIHDLNSHSTPYELDDDLTLDADLKLGLTTYVNNDGIIYKGVIPFIHDFNFGDNSTVTTDGYNVFIGSAGNFVLGGNDATEIYHGSYNVGIGFQALLTNTTGNYNNAIGISALRHNTTGYHNNAFGEDTLRHNTEGTFNVGVGNGPLRRNTVGDNNVAIGRNPLSYNISGNNTIAIGENAACMIGDGSDNTMGDNNICIGNSTRILLDNDTNEIVIGENGRGNGSNTTTIGNTNTINTYLKGVLNIGVTSNYADNAAAVAGGLVIGDVYRNGDVLMVVHS